MSSSDENYRYKRGILSKLLTPPLLFLGWCLMALLFNICLEFAGMFFKWWDSGLEHSKKMLIQELAWLNSDFSSLFISPAQVAESFNKWLYWALFIWGGQDILAKLLSFSLIRPLYEFIAVVVNVIKLFGVRLVVMLFSLPVFILFSLVAFVDGLVKRDLRKWAGGRESSYVFHHAKGWIKPSIFLPFVLYLSIPVSVHPAWIVLPFALCLAMAVGISTYMFKKYV